MKLIFLCGPPASGKLTIAEKLSQLANIPLFHNHLSRDLVKDIYGDKLRENYAIYVEVI
jgi:shikimate kinase